MRQEDKLKEKVGTHLPYRVPADYFKSFKSGLMEKLPEFPEQPKEKRLTPWQRVKPYIYLAAMFAGIWCMMQIFHKLSSNDDRGQETYTLATYEPDSYDLYINDYMDNSTGADIALEDEVTELYPSMEEFKRDFYAQL